MGALIQKKISITNEQKRFLENYKRWGFSDQSSIIRQALNLFINELTTRERKTLMAQKAQELLSDYTKDKDITAFTDLDGEDFI
ncbi:MAG: hypothetical protein JRE28_11620 [Deltaproteobacteria bacterium]|nr:hypothetical protein [Deltaproteobacteria bacterium]